MTFRLELREHNDRSRWVLIVTSLEPMYEDIRKAIAEARAENRNPEILDFSTLDRAHLFGLEIDTGAGWIDV